MTNESLVVQLQSLLRFERQANFTTVILDEVCSLLSYFSADSASMFKDMEGRQTMLPFTAALERRCREADYLILADADLLMNDTVRHFVDGVCAGREVHTLQISEVKPFVQRTLKVNYDSGIGQSVGFPRELLEAIQAVKSDPEERIFIACNAKKLAAQENRTLPSGSNPSYYDVLVMNGIRPDEIVVVHGEVGSKEKCSMFSDLSGVLRDKKVLIATTAVTVGINIEVKFGRIFAHTHRNTSTVRDMMQLLVRRQYGTVRFCPGGVQVPMSATVQSRSHQLSACAVARSAAGT